jgi:hypothetical protein
MSESDWERIVTEYGDAVEALNETASRARVVVAGQWRMREAITPEFQAEVLRREARFDAAREALHGAMKVQS